MFGGFIPRLNQSREDGARAYAVIDGNGDVLNVIVLKEGANWKPPEGCTLVLSEDYERANGRPPEPKRQPPTPAMLRKAALFAMEQKRRADALAAALADPNAPQAVKDYAASMAKER